MSLAISQSSISAVKDVAPQQTSSKKNSNKNSNKNINNNTENNIDNNININNQKKDDLLPEDWKARCEFLKQELRIKDFTSLVQDRLYNQEYRKILTQIASHKTNVKLENSIYAAKENLYKENLYLGKGMEECSPKGDEEKNISERNQYDLLSGRIGDIENILKARHSHIGAKMLALEVENLFLNLAYVGQSALMSDSFGATYRNTEIFKKHILPYKYLIAPGKPVVNKPQDSNNVQDLENVKPATQEKNSFEIALFKQDEMNKLRNINSKIAMVKEIACIFNALLDRVYPLEMNLNKQKNELYSLDEKKAIAQNLHSINVQEVKIIYKEFDDIKDELNAIATNLKPGTYSNAEEQAKALCLKTELDGRLKVVETRKGEIEAFLKYRTDKFYSKFGAALTSHDKPSVNMINQNEKCLTISNLLNELVCLKELGFCYSKSLFTLKDEKLITPYANKINIEYNLLQDRENSVIKLGKLEIQAENENKVEMNRLKNIILEDFAVLKSARQKIDKIGTLLGERASWRYPVKEEQKK